ncbi:MULTISPECIES: gamma-type small acid-soluble spore protein [Rossellomorea]|jgi:small acid-soluble spore protein E (minor gamma-type SASP)|uniref:Small, acid-soluble spore protein gamma-type n=1 Tax=Rossellomorea aquimaris TaxID=189382 RepID=A0A366ENS4_9BACI|nr:MULTISPECIES: gamma-type small acid-soluble spore protein [Rossellomorea]MDT9026964.1 gamma-type small acid-soluble spore protein [Rossellomorea sp. YC4-1]RBP03330.1 small acid-soluble spore protein E (minor gamma-type SASP) [Rossellomorea aquimaris]TYS82194.1 gamma-type small acid-soluble spore protein [Rossellomorea aquimaris]TYS88823.1 gamma-type small acid-soluble spore protein [Rossellomorea aquimaris]TYS89482.1 gamma-type small acid-soluble spore protein [Rossellomorea aquimaris]
MAKQPNKTQAGTSVQHVKQQNAQAGQAQQQQYGTEFASETTAAQHVKQQNQQAEANKAKASGKYGQQQQ